LDELVFLLVHLTQVYPSYSPTHAYCTHPTYPRSLAPLSLPGPAW